MTAFAGIRGWIAAFAINVIAVTTGARNIIEGSPPLPNVIVGLLSCALAFIAAAQIIKIGDRDV